MNKKSHVYMAPFQIFELKLGKKFIRIFKALCEWSKNFFNNLYVLHRWWLNFVDTIHPLKNFNVIIYFDIIIKKKF